MSGELPIGEGSLGESTPLPPATASTPFFDPSVTVISQYANSPIILALIDDFSAWIDPQADLDAFFNTVWNVDTAVGFGLDIWGRIVGVNRVLPVSAGQFLGFASQSDVESLGHGIFFSGENATTNFALSDQAFRTLILAKALSNITDGSIPAINQILLNLFPAYGNSFVRDNLDMTMTFVFGARPSPVDLTIITQSGVLPKPAGVAVLVEHP